MHLKLLNIKNIKIRVKRWEEMVNEWKGNLGEGKTHTMIEEGFLVVENIKFYVKQYKNAVRWFWGSFISGILAIFISLLPLLWKELCYGQVIIFIWLALIFAIGTIIAILCLLVNIFAEPRQKEWEKI